MYAIEHGLTSPVAHRLASLTLSVIAFSIVVHGVSITALFQHRRGKSPG
jgi:NhaP-type Na+/H+ or K+/H+ antiporter